MGRRQQGAAAVGVDFSAMMLRVAHEKSHAAAVVLGDGRLLPFRSASFTAVVSAFTLRNLSPLMPALQEAARVLEPGGQLGLLEVDQPQGRMAFALHRVYFRRVVPIVGGVLSGDRNAYRYLPDSVQYLPSTEELGSMLASAGFGRITKRYVGMGAAQIVVAVRE